jgi:hypothetical protein
MKTIWKFWSIMAVLALFPLVSGCVAVLAGAAGAGTVAWVQGRLDATLNGGFNDTEKAANLAIKQLQFVLINEHKDALNAELKARTSEDKEIKIKVIRVTETATQVQIRVGLFGDEGQSLAILDKIKANL